MAVHLLYDETFLGHDTGVVHFETSSRLRCVIAALIADPELRETPPRNFTAGHDAGPSAMSQRRNDSRHSYLHRPWWNSSGYGHAR